MVGFGWVWCGTVWYGAVRQLRHGKAGLGTVWCGRVWQGPARYGLAVRVWFGQVR
jgi:hypothetical protein